jgi:superfamily II DNA or RNA helicase
MILRPYQRHLDDSIHEAWAAGARNVLAVSPTGGGKTVNMAAVIRRHTGASIVIAHRPELVSQASLTLARNGIRHRVIGPSTLIRNVVAIHMKRLGRSWYDPGAATGVAGVDMLIRRPPDDPWFRQITLWQQDEAHHVLAENKWGKAATLFPNARGLGWTATPCRADGKGLGVHADGIMDVMVVGPSMRELIAAGYLTDYRIWAPPSDVDISAVPITDSGDFSPPKLRTALHKSHIVGDVVAHYLRHARGKLGVTFAVGVEHATEMAAAYRAVGVPAEVVTSKTPDLLRISILARFERREILQLVNVDLFGEGFDLPAIEVVSMARPTASYSLYAQQFGRALRLLPPEALAARWDEFTDDERRAHIAASAKPVGIIIDHVGNVVRHGGPPDRPRKWTLDRRERRARQAPADDVIPYRTCPMCTTPYERIYRACPYCEHVPEPASRGAPDQVDGDLIELDGATLAALRGEIARVDGPARIPMGVTGPAGVAIARRHGERQEAQRELRENIALWAGYWRDRGAPDSEIYRRFFHGFGVDIATAQTLGAREAGELSGTVQAGLLRALDGAVKV